MLNYIHSYESHTDFGQMSSLLIILGETKTTEIWKLVITI